MSKKENNEVDVDKKEMESVLSKEIKEIFTKEVTPFGTGAKVGVPKRYLGKEVYVIVCKE
ncbi:MAG: DUF2080 family transposase-associated protein [Thermoplasmatota archaeon]